MSSNDGISYLQHMALEHRVDELEDENAKLRETIKAYEDRIVAADTAANRAKDLYEQTISVARVVTKLLSEYNDGNESAVVLALSILESLSQQPKI